MDLEALREQICQFLKFYIPDEHVTFDTHHVEDQGEYHRFSISYTSVEGEPIPAFLLVPVGAGPFAAVLVHHQHHGQRHFGKSEVCGLVGDDLQAFGPALARQGLIVLAPDSICFEDRRRNRRGVEPEPDRDVEQHYNEMCYRLLRGDTLMRKVLSDSARGVSLLAAHPLVNAEWIGILGHSYGGNTVLFHGALDERVRFACSSGAACSYQHKMDHEVGIEMAEVIPYFAKLYDMPDLLACFSPRPVLIVSATEDAASKDAEMIVETAQETCASLGYSTEIEHKRYAGGHSLTLRRFNDIVEWLTNYAL